MVKAAFETVPEAVQVRVRKTKGKRPAPSLPQWRCPQQDLQNRIVPWWFQVPN